MSDEQTPEAADSVEAGPSAPRTLKDLIGELSLMEWIRTVKAGLNAPRDSGEYAYAIQQVKRLWSPAAGIVLPMIMLTVLLMMPDRAPEAAETVQVTVMETAEPPKLDEIKQVEPPPPDKTEPPPEVNPDVTAVSDNFAPGPPGPPGLAPGPFSPVPAEFDSVAMVRSPIVMRGIYASRMPGARGTLSGQGGGGGGATERAVYLALRWLKKYQDYDGKWMAGAGGGQNYSGGVPAAMTGLGLLTFLAHGETPASVEFGETVEKAIRWLVENQEANGRFKSGDGHEYSHPIATYAVCEAYGMTKIPLLKNVAEKAVDVIVKGRNPGGGYNYNCDKSGRDDTSYTAWCAQALKAAKMAGVHNGELADGMQTAIQGIKNNADQYGGIGYASKGSCRLTGAGVLALQFLGHARDSEVRSGLQWMQQNSVCKWEPQKGRPLYWWYYETQAFFQDGGGGWKQWNPTFAIELCKNQIVVKGAGLDGKDIGYWKPIGDEEDCGFVYDTTLCALMLEVYYRFLPTYQEIKADADDGQLRDKKEDVEIKINI